MNNAKGGEARFAGGQREQHGSNLSTIAREITSSRVSASGTSIRINVCRRLAPRAVQPMEANVSCPHGLGKHNPRREMLAHHRAIRVQADRKPAPDRHTHHPPQTYLHTRTRRGRCSVASASRDGTVKKAAKLASYPASQPHIGVATPGVRREVGVLSVRHSPSFLTCAVQLPPLPNAPLSFASNEPCPPRRACQTGSSDAWPMLSGWPVLARADRRTRWEGGGRAARQD